MKKLIALFVCMAALTISALAADTNDTSLFNAGELGLSLGTGYTVDTAAAFKQPYAVNLQAGAFWFPWKHFGFEADVPFYSTKGLSLQEVQAGVVARLPLSDHVFLLKNIAPYVGLDAVYNWQTDTSWAYVAKAGTEFRFNKKWGVFGEYQYRNDGFTWSKGQDSIVGGLKFVF